MKQMLKRPMAAIAIFALLQSLSGAQAQAQAQAQHQEEQKPIPVTTQSELQSLGSQAAAGSDEQVYPSPYFVDNVHCEGFNFGEITGEVLGEDYLKVLNSTKNQEDCETFFRMMGIEKLTWVPTEEFEILAEKIRRLEGLEGKLDEIDVTLKKSELKNHVHVILKAKRKAVSHKSFAYGYQLGKGDGDRQDHTVSGEWTSLQGWPIGEVSYGFNFRKSMASPLLADISFLTPTVPVTELETLTRKEFSYFDLYLDQKKVINHYLRSDFKFTAFFQDRSYKNGLLAEWAPHFLFSAYRGLLGTTELAPALLLYSIREEVPNLNDPNIDISRTYSGVAPGFRFNQRLSTPLNEFLISASYFTAPQIDFSQFKYGLDMNWRIGGERSFFSRFGVVANFDEVQNSIVPSKYLGLDSYRSTESGVYVVSDLTSDKKMKLKTTFGREDLSTDLPLRSHLYDVSSEKFVESTQFLSVDWTYAAKDWDFIISGKYQSDRMY